MQNNTIVNTLSEVTTTIDACKDCQGHHNNEYGKHKLIIRREYSLYHLLCKCTKAGVTTNK